MTARFMRGTATLNLDSGRFSIGEGCRPPSIQREFNLAAGSAANTLGGDDMVSSKAINRDWSFTVRDLGASVADVESGARAISNFLIGAGDPANPTYFEFKSDSLPVPLWGQYDAPLRYEVVAGYAELGQEYDSALYLRARGIMVAVTLTVKPVALGRQQRLATAMGGIMEDNWGSVDGMSRGLILSPARTNKMTNPVFGAATWNTGWSAASVIVAQNIDPMFLLPGQTNSAKITQTGGGFIYYQQINVGNTNVHNFSAIVVKPDLSSVTASDCQIYYGAQKTSIYVPLGNGRYLVKAENIAGINALTNTGLFIAAGKTVYLLAMQAEEGGAYATPIFWGDLLGCAWTGTAHGSTSSRTAAYVRLPIATDTINLAYGAVRVSFTPQYDSSHPFDIYFFDTRDAGHLTNLVGYWAYATQQFTLSDGTNTVTSTAKTWAVGDKLSLVFTWGPGGLNIYLNGTRIANGATFTYPTPGSYLYIGSNYGPSGHVGSTLTGFSVFDAELTQAQVTADYANIAPILAAGEQVETVPWLWTKDGDDVVDQYYDASHNNFFVSGGIPGSLPSSYQMAINHQQGADPFGEYLFCLSNLDLNVAINPNFLFFDQSGSAGAGLVGGQELVSSVADMGWLGLSTNLLAAQEKYLEGREIFTLVRLLDAGTGTLAWAGVDVAGSQTFSGEVIPISATNRTVVFLPPYIVPKVSTPRSLINLAPAVLSIRAMLGRRGTTQTFSVDFYTIMPSPMMVIEQIYTSSWSSKMLVHDGVIDHYRGANAYPSTLFDYQYTGSYRGRWVDLLPNCINHMFVMGMAGTYVDTVITHTFTFSIQVAPRWSLI